MLTRPADQADSWRTALTQVGAVVVDYPTTTIGPPPSWAPLDMAFARLGSYDWLLYTSAAAARFAHRRFPAGTDPSSLARPLIAAVGAETARVLATLGFRVALVPQDQRQEGLVAAFKDLPPGSRMLFPRALGGRDHLVDALRARAIEVDVVPASETVAITPLPPLPPFDVATFASPSALKAFVDQLGRAPLLAGPSVVIGATTAATAATFGLQVVVTRAPNVDALVEALVGLRAPGA